ncbi:MAG: peptide chain release factor N(5)-glutamine methyltransferase [Bacteroidales bacterium]|nr:peptide chain release factor N(5)-glutamine methyltransferase [Bacteroidales bacterium]
MKVPSNKIGDIRSYYSQKLFKFYDERETEIFIFMLIEEYSGISKLDIFINPEQTINESELLKIHFAVKDLMNYKPIQYILGKTEFYGFPILVNTNVLIPRPETEELVDWVVNDIGQNQEYRVLDIGSGSGCIAIALKHALPILNIQAIDFSLGAIDLAEQNAKMNQADVSFYHINLLDKNEWGKLGYYDIIISNPPYVRHAEKSQMKKNVLNYEPESAVFVENNNPLIFYKSLAEFGLDHLNLNGSMYCEINQYLGDETYKLFKNLGFKDVQLKKDIKGNSRFVKAVENFH